ncbi:MAG: hypothetical protein HOC05_01310 [Gemmatimonadetes bacterium]|nr:hypothetical protein [Gemmatimonadota bacterium]
MLQEPGCLFTLGGFHPAGASDATVWACSGIRIKAPSNDEFVSRIASFQEQAVKIVDTLHMPHFAAEELPGIVLRGVDLAIGA